MCIHQALKTTSAHELGLIRVTSRTKVGQVKGEQWAWEERLDKMKMHQHLYSICSRKPTHLLLMITQSTMKMRSAKTWVQSSGIRMKWMKRAYKLTSMILPQASLA